MRPDRPIWVLAGNRRIGTCGRCHKPIVFLVSTPHGKRVPFSQDPLVLATQENAGGVRFEHVSIEHLHFITCRPPRKAAAKSAAKRANTVSMEGQS